MDTQTPRDADGLPLEVGLLYYRTGYALVDLRRIERVHYSRRSVRDRLIVTFTAGHRVRTCPASDFQDWHRWPPTTHTASAS